MLSSFVSQHVPQRVESQTTVYSHPFFAVVCPSNVLLEGTVMLFLPILLHSDEPACRASLPFPNIALSIAIEFLSYMHLIYLATGAQFPLFRSFASITQIISCDNTRPCPLPCSSIFSS